MFCPKCGTKVLDSATFCQKCGAKLIVDIPAQQALTSTPVRQTQAQTHNIPSDTPKKKKSKKLPIILGIAVLVIAVVIFVALNWEGKTDYVATVRAHQPFISQGTSLTYGEVLDGYISSADWKVRNSGNVTYVDISGKAKGKGNELFITIKVTNDPSDPDLVKITLESVAIDGEKSPTYDDAVEFLLAMFLAYDGAYNDLSELLSGTGLVGAQRDVSLTDTYTNEVEGFSFKYPSDWTIMEGTELYNASLDDTAVVSLYAPDGFGSASNVLVNKTLADYTLFYYTKSDFEREFSSIFDEVSVTDLSNFNIDGVPAIELGLSINTDKGPMVVVRYYYIVGDYTYIVSGTIRQSAIDSDGLVIDAIMGSYTITAANTSNVDISSGTDVFVDVLNEYVGYINEGTYTNGKYVFHDIDGNGVDELLVCYEDMMDGYTDIYTYVDGTTYKIGEFWSRKSLLLDEDGNFYIIGNNDAANTILELARISTNGTDLVTTEAWEMNGSIFTHTSPNGDEVISEREYQIASDRFFNITTDFVDSLNWQSLSATVGNGTLDNSNSVGVTTNDITGTTIYVEFSESYSEGYEPAVVLYQDGRFDFYANMAETMNIFSGTYTTYEDSYIFRVAETEFYVDFEFSMRFSNDALIYEGVDPLGMTNYGAVFSLSATPPKSVMDVQS